MCGGGGQQIDLENTKTDQTTTQDINQTTVTEIDPFLRQLQTNYLGTLTDFLQNAAPTYYPGTQVAPFAPQSLLSNALLTQQTTSPGLYTSLPLANLSAAYAASPVVGQTAANQLSSLANVLDPNFVDPRTNPFTAAAADAANRQTVATLVNQALPAIRTGAIGAGQFGGSRQGIAEGTAIGGAAQAIADATSRAYFDQFNQNLRAQMQAQAIAPSALTAAQQPIANAISQQGQANAQLFQNLGMLDAAGTQFETQAQNIANGEIQQWLYNNQVPFQMMQTFAQGLGIVGGIGGTTTQTTTGQNVSHTVGTGAVSAPAPYTSPIQNAVAGGLAGFGLATGASSMFPAIAGSMGMIAPWLVAGGALLGLFL